MSIFDLIKNVTIYSDKYQTHSEAIIISCYFNPQKSSYRLKAFNTFYDSIKHLNHRIIECVIGDSEPQLPQNDNIKCINTPTLLWHKETLLNKIVSELPKKYKYVFWIDADVLFTNKNWLVEGVAQLQNNNIIQPFEYCVHLDKDQLYPSFSLSNVINTTLPNKRNNKVWRSFCANFVTSHLWKDENYNNHGHVGFAWGARREILDAVPLYDRALIGGADHIIAHAAAGQINHSCIEKSFTNNIDEVNEWSLKFYKVAKKKIGYVKGELYHIWHGDIVKREYFKRVQEFTPKIRNINTLDKNGLYVANQEDEQYMKEYFKRREVSDEIKNDDGFVNSMLIGYATDSTLLGTIIGGNLTGAIIGDMLNDNNSNISDNGIDNNRDTHNTSNIVTDSTTNITSNDDNPFS